MWFLRTLVHSLSAVLVQRKLWPQLRVVSRRRSAGVTERECQVGDDMWCKETKEWQGLRKTIPGNLEQNGTKNIRLATSYQYYTEIGGKRYYGEIVSIPQLCAKNSNARCLGEIKVAAKALLPFTDKSTSGMAQPCILAFNFDT